MKTPNKENIDTMLSKTKGYVDSEISKVNNELDDKQDTLTAGTNITIDANNVISASGGLTEVTANDVNSEQATSGQVLTADGNGGANWQNASGGNAVTLGTETQTFEDSKTFNLRLNRSITFQQNNNTSKFVKFNIRNPDVYFQIAGGTANIILYQDRILLTKTQGNSRQIDFQDKSGTLALTSDIDAKVPDAPDTDGTYTLKCVVSNGGTTKTYQWVLDN